MRKKILITLSLSAAFAVSLFAGFSGTNTYVSTSGANKDGKKTWRYGEGENTTTFRISSGSPSPTLSPTPTATPTATLSPSPSPTAAPTSYSWPAFTIDLHTNGKPIRTGAIKKKHGWLIQKVPAMGKVTCPCGPIIYVITSKNPSVCGIVPFLTGGTFITAHIVNIPAGSCQ